MLQGIGGKSVAPPLSPSQLSRKRAGRSSTHPTSNGAEATNGIVTEESPQTHLFFATLTFSSHTMSTHNPPPTVRVTNCSRAACTRAPAWMPFQGACRTEPNISIETQHPLHKAQPRCGREP